MSLSGSLFKAARIVRTAEAVGSGKPDKMARRAKNIVVGRALARFNFWNWLWGGKK